MKLDWSLNILDVIIIVLTVLSIIVTVYVAYHVQGIHGHIRNFNEVHVPDIKDLLMREYPQDGNLDNQSSMDHRIA